MKTLIGSCENDKGFVHGPAAECVVYLFLVLGVDTFKESQCIVCMFMDPSCSSHELAYGWMHEHTDSTLTFFECIYSHFVSWCLYKGHGHTYAHQ